MRRIKMIFVKLRCRVWCKSKKSREICRLITKQYAPAKNVKNISEKRVKSSVCGTGTLIKYRENICTITRRTISNKGIDAAIFNISEATPFKNIPLSFRSHTIIDVHNDVHAKCDTNKNIYVILEPGLLMKVIQQL